MDLNFFLLIVAITINTLLAFIVYKNNPKSITNIVFSLLSIVTSTWLVVFYLPLLPSFLPFSLQLIRLSLFFAVPQAMLFFILSQVLPNEKITISKGKLITLLIWSSIIMIVTISPFTFTEVKFIDDSPYPTAGAGMLLFAPTVVLFSVAAIYTLIKRILKSPGLIKEQLRFVLFGIIAMLGLLITTVLIPVTLFDNNSFVPFAPFYTLIFLAATGYAIIKHRLLDIRLVVARTVAYTLIIGIVGVFYTLSTILVSNLFFRDLSTNEQIILFTTLTIIVAFTFQPLRRYLQKITDSFFYKGRYDSSELISNLTKIMATTLGLEDLSKGLLANLIPEMRINKGAFVLVKKGRIDAVESYNYKTKPKFTGTDIDSLLEQEKILILEDLDNKKLKGLMNDLDLALAAPLKIGDETLGMLLLGHKLSGEIYTEQDIKLLQILSPEISIAINNAKAYEEIRKFNVTLQREIQKATVDLKFANEKLKELDRLKDEFVVI